MIGSTTMFIDNSESVFIDIKLKNAITIELIGNYKITHEILKNEKITEIGLDSYLLEVNDKFEFEIENIKYLQTIRQIIKKENSNIITLVTEDRNTSRLFILPTLGKTSDHYSIDKYFVNSFLTKNNKDDYANFYLVYRSARSNDYIKLEYKLRNHPCFVDCFDFNNTDLLVEFKIPTIYLPEVKKFVLGQYSKFTLLFQTVVLNFWKPYSAGAFCGFLEGVFKKDRLIFEELYGDLGQEVLAEIDEVFSKPDLVKENINYL